MKFHYKCTVEYDGSSYDGWQKQHNTVNTIQCIIENTLTDYLDEHISIRGSGRTDKGVHAYNQVFDFFTAASIDTAVFIKAVNSTLPDTIRIKDIALVPRNFHSRKSARSKTYDYLIDMGQIPTAFNRRYHYVPDVLPSIELMQQAAVQLCTTMDFSAFTSEKRPNYNYVRTIYSIGFIMKDNILTIRYTGNGFLYNMVRILTGTLIDIGTNKIPLDDLPHIISCQKRELAGFTAPSNALFLKEVLY